MDLVSMYPEGINGIVRDDEIDELENYYQKPIEKITDSEIRDWEELVEAIEFDKMCYIN